MPNGNMLANFVSRVVGTNVIRDVTALKMVAITFCFHTLLVVAALFLIDALPSREVAGFLNPSAGGTPPIVEKFIKWDAHWYTYIAEHGYDIQSVVFFPLTILLIKALAGIGLGYVTAGFVVCNLFTLISYYVMAKTFLLDFPESETQRALFAYATLPTSFFLNSVYTEPVFIVFSFACIYCVRTKSWWWAGLFAALAALTRNLGILLTVVLLCEFVRHYFKKRKLKLSMLSLFFPVLALGAFCAYNNSMFGDPLAFINSQQSWGRRFGLPWDNIWNDICLIYSGVPIVEIGIYLDILLAAMAFIALVFVSTVPKYRIPWPYVLIGWLWFLVPLFSTSPIYPLYSMARFVLVVFPLYLFFARLPKVVFYCLICVNAVGLLLSTALFINWCWLG
ncbi:mannosyltransferase family protein [Sporomusa sp.]|uniref:mannosyltransferase family protein n=1 Tax=Sporomusa sp. TaxID=2078658 RepID=UPI002C1DAE29|nr:mannosyltransferase family protein [Sporomusa sp.]HWR41700.1 mannosyltransferase family protein [Sporomusa sp.]